MDKYSVRVYLDINKDGSVGSSWIVFHDVVSSSITSNGDLIIDRIIDEKAIYGATVFARGEWKLIEREEE